MKNNKIIIGVLTLLGLGFLGAYSFANADSLKTAGREGKGFFSARHEKMDKIFENKDYRSWENEMKEHRGIDKDMINRENFSKFSQMHKLREEGRDKEADKIRDDLGLHRRGHGEEGHRGMMHRGERGDHEDGEGHCGHFDRE